MSRTAKLNLVAALLAAALVSAMVLRTSRAAFTGSTVNPGNSWAAGEVSLDDDRGGVAMFSATDWVPGDSDDQCIEVSYTGSAVPAAAVVLDATVAGTGLADDLDLVVSIRAAGETCATASPTTTPVYAGTLADMDDEDSTWTPTAAGGADAVRAFDFHVELGADTPNEAQGETATATFTWSATS